MRPSAFFCFLDGSAWRCEFLPRVVRSTQHDGETRDVRLQRRPVLPLQSCKMDSPLFFPTALCYNPLTYVFSKWPAFGLVKRESGVTPERSGHCKRGVCCICHCIFICEKAQYAKIRKPGNLLAELVETLPVRADPQVTSPVGVPVHSRPASKRCGAGCSAFSGQRG